MTAEPLAIGIVGAGAIAGSYVDVVLTSQEAQVVGVADTDPEASASLASAFDCPSFGSHEQMAKSVGLDAVVVCTPPATHEEIATYVLGEGIPVLCEGTMMTLPGGIQMFVADHLNVMLSDLKA